MWISKILLELKKLTQGFMHFSHSDRSTLRGGPRHAAAYGASFRWFVLDQSLGSSPMVKQDITDRLSLLKHNLNVSIHVPFERSWPITFLTDHAPDEFCDFSLTVPVRVWNPHHDTGTRFNTQSKFEQPAQPTFSSTLVFSREGCPQEPHVPQVVSS